MFQSSNMFAHVPKKNQAVSWYFEYSYEFKLLTSFITCVLLITPGLLYDFDLITG